MYNGLEKLSRRVVCNVNIQNRKGHGEAYTRVAHSPLLRNLGAPFGVKVPLIAPARPRYRDAVALHLIYRLWRWCSIPFPPGAAKKTAGGKRPECVVAFDRLGK
jgi:hypothetical protein